MFKRRHPLRFIRRIREFIWPTMGWKRVSLYIGHRLVRLKESNYRISMGLAAGGSVSFTPLPGTHFIQGVLFAYILRGNPIAAIIGTFYGNPWTFPFMWWAAYEVGVFTFQLLGFEVAQMPDHFDWDALVYEIKTEPQALLLPWLAGGYILTFASLPFFYALSYWFVLQARAYQVRWKQRRMHKDAKEMTGQKS